MFEPLSHLSHDITLMSKDVTAWTDIELVIDYQNSHQEILNKKI